MEYNIYIKYSLEDIMFITRRIGAKSKDLKKIEKLYIEAFPENERFSFSKMIKNEIDFIYSDTKPAPKQALLSVIA